MRGEIKRELNVGKVANASRLVLAEVYSEDKMNQSLYGIQQVFKSNGYFQSQVQSRFTYDQRTNQVRIDFEVQSGRRAKYRTPTLIGDWKMPPEKVISATRWKGWFGWRPVTQSNTQRGLSSVRKKSQGRDRLMARITVEKIDFDEDTGTARPALNIRAGPKVSVTAVGVKISRGKLQRYVPVFEEHTVDDDLLVEGQRNLRDYFQSEGYFEAEVEFKAQRVVNDKAQIDYIVNPGKRHKLVQVDIEGNHYFDTRTIRERMFLLPASLQFSRGRYSESYLRRDEESITNLYQENGFRDVKVSSKVVDTDLTNRGLISVTIHIDEGPQWIISKLEVDGIAQLDRKTILAKLSSTEGQPFSEFEVAVDRDNILSEYFSQGFPNATFEWSSKPGAAPDRVELRFKIAERHRRFILHLPPTALHPPQ